MEQEVNTPYKSNYTLGIIITITALLYVVGNSLSTFAPTLTCVGGFAGLISGILVMIWYYRSCMNLRAFNNQGLKYSPWLAAFSFLIPIANLALPYLIALEIWKASDPDASTVGWKQSKNGTMVILWWLSFFIMLVLSFIGMGAAFASGIEAGMSGIEPNMDSLAMGVSIPTIIGMALFTIFQISVIVLTNDRQDEKAENLGLL
jgi:hypothetical protein